jgi:hypothetical protein
MVFPMLAGDRLGVAVKVVVENGCRTCTPPPRLNWLTVIEVGLGRRVASTESDPIGIAQIEPAPSPAPPGENVTC